MTQSNVTVQGAPGNVGQGDEGSINIVENDKGLTISIPSHLKVGGLVTKNGNLTIATTHGNIMLPSGLNLSVNLWSRGSTKAPRRNVTVS